MTRNTTDKIWNALEHGSMIIASAPIWLTSFGILFLPFLPQRTQEKSEGPIDMEAESHDVTTDEVLRGEGDVRSCYVTEIEACDCSSFIKKIIEEREFKAKNIDTHHSK